MRDLLRVSDLEPVELVDLLELALAAKDAPSSVAGAGAGRVCAVLFEKPSLRTRFSVESALARIGAHPIGAYDREGGVSLFKAGRIGFLLDEPLRVTVFEPEKLPFAWDIAMPVGAPGGKRTEFSTTGHWVMASKSKNKEAAWAWIKFISTAPFSKAYNLHYAFVPVRNDVDVSKGDVYIKKNLKYALCCWDGLKTHPKIAQLLDVYGRAIEAAAGGTAVADALKSGQAEAQKVLTG